MDIADSPKLSDVVQQLQRGDHSPEFLRQLLTDMIFARRWSARLFSLQRQGRIGTFSPIDGEEAAVVGAARALEAEFDWIVPQYREPLGLNCLGKEILFRTILSRRGHRSGGYFSPPIKIMPVQISIAAQIPHAVGLAWGLRIRGDQGIVLVFFGDGATSEGDFYEALNLAGVVRAPVVFCCLNNGWAISTPTSAQTAAKTLAAKAVAAGIPGLQVDGNDVLAVYDAVSQSRAQAIAGDGPTFIEAVTYRLGPHTTADDPTRYVPSDELASWRARDPLDVFRTRLEEASLWDDDAQNATESEADQRFDEALAAAEQEPVSPDTMFDHLFMEASPRLASQRRQFLSRPHSED